MNRRSFLGLLGGTVVILPSLDLFNAPQAVAPVSTAWLESIAIMSNEETLSQVVIMDADTTRIIDAAFLAPGAVYHLWFPLATVELRGGIAALSIDAPPMTAWSAGWNDGKGHHYETLSDGQMVALNLTA